MNKNMTKKNKMNKKCKLKTKKNRNNFQIMNYLKDPFHKKTMMKY